MPKSACTCLWTPCRCDWIDGLTPAERIKQQEILVDRFWQRRPGRMLERKEAERKQVLATRATDARGIDNLTKDEREARRTLSGTPSNERNHPNTHKASAARQSACVYCGVNDGKTERLEGTVLHREFCRAAWMRDWRNHRTKTDELAEVVNSSWKGIR